jgi:glycosyltransferase involved in cell wall biosynthesis
VSGPAPSVEISVVVPVFDNAGTLDALIDRLIAQLEPRGKSFELVFVDDASRDGSLALLRRRAAADPRLRVLALRRNCGGQSAVCAGFDQVRGRRVVCLDADLENDPADVPKLLDALDQGYDLACGVRVGRRGPLSRRVASALFNAYVRRRFARSVSDIGCGMRAMDARLARELASAGERRRLLTPLLIDRARSVVEVPIRHDPASRPGGHGFFSLLAIAIDFYLISARRPFLYTGTASLAALAAAPVALVAAWPARSETLALAGLVLAAAGGVGATVSLAGQFAQRLYELAQGRPYYELREDDAEEAAPDARLRAERGGG